MSNTKRVAEEMFKPFTPPKAEWFIFYLLKIITNAIIKAIAMIVIVINPKNNNFIICNNNISIAPPRFLTDELCNM